MCPPLVPFLRRLQGQQLLNKLAAALAERQLSRLPNVTFAGFAPVEELKQLSYSREMDQIATSAHRISCPAAVNRKWPDWYSYLRFSLCCNAITLSSSDVQKCLVYALPLLWSTCYKLVKLMEITLSCPVSLWPMDVRNYRWHKT